MTQPSCWQCVKTTPKVSPGKWPPDDGMECGASPEPPAAAFILRNEPSLDPLKRGVRRLALRPPVLGFPRRATRKHAWPHMLRHSCGYYLADQGTDLRTMRDCLGHRDPKHTAHYTRVPEHRFERLWR